MRKTLPTLALLLAAAAAHADADLKAVSKHGGTMIETADGTILEVTGDAVYLYEHGGTPLAAAGASGRIVVGGGAAIALEAAGDNRLKLAQVLPPGAKAVISIKLPGRAPIQTRLEGH